MRENRDRALCFGYLAKDGYTHLLREELKDITAEYDRLILAAPNQKVFWSQNIWYSPTVTDISSISDAARILRGVQRSWWPYAWNYFRRIELIKEKLPYISEKPLTFLGPAPSSPLGSFTLIDEKTLLYSGDCESSLPNGQWNFLEDKIHPPSRAYLKLWELFTRYSFYPSKDDVCLDLGACPGGWTWVLAKLCKKVIAIDRSELDPRIMGLPNVQFIKKDAFKINLADYPHALWVFSDVVCYPDKLYDFIRELLENFPDKKYVFTIKFQGTGHRSVIEKFERLPGKLLSLSQNKHELTWFKV